MKFAIKLSATALKEEAEAYLYYEKESEVLGDRFLNEVEETLKRIEQNPTHYSYSDQTRTIRDIALVKFPFAIIFQVIEDSIIIYNIHHTKKSL